MNATEKKMNGLREPPFGSIRKRRDEILNRDVADFLCAKLCSILCEIIIALSMCIQMSAVIALRSIMETSVEMYVNADFCSKP